MGETMDGTMNREVEQIKDQYPMSDYKDPLLGEVVTIGEAMLLWKKSRNAIKNACLTRGVEARVSLTGGAWLITVSSLVERYGKPEKDVLQCLKS